MPYETLMTVFRTLLYKPGFIKEQYAVFIKEIKNLNIASLCI
jgi:hypothetical protein